MSLAHSIISQISTLVRSIFSPPPTRQITLPCMPGKKSNPVAMNSSQSAQGMLCIMVQRLHGFSTRKPGTGRLAVLSCTVCFFSDGESILANSRYREQSHSILCRQYECSSNELEVAKCFVGSQSVLPTSWSLSGEETTSLNVL